MPDWLFIKVHHNFADHPKTVELSDKAFRQLVTAWGFCARNLNDGKLTKAQAKNLFTPKSLRELLAAPYIHETPDGFQMHEYIEHQMSAVDVSDLREKRAAAGKAGGKAKATNLANASPVAKQTASKTVADLEVEVELEVTNNKTPPTEGIAPPAQKSKRTRIPENFEPTPDMIRWARDRCPNITQQFLELCTRKFIDHFENATRNAMKVNWIRTWENWIESDYQRNPPPPRVNGTNGHPVIRSTTDERVAHTLNRAAQVAAEERAEEERQHRLEITA